MKRLCLDCGRLASATRCDDCRRARQRRDDARRGPRPQYAYAHQQARRRVLERDGWTCAHCHRTADTVNRVVPVARGGSSHFDNLVAACGSRNYRNGAHR